MTQTYNELLKHPLVNVSKELTPPKPVHPVHDELCQREIKVKVNTLNSLFQIFNVTLTILQLYHSGSMATHCEKKCILNFSKCAVERLESFQTTVKVILNNVICACITVYLVSCYHFKRMHQILSYVKTFELISLHFSVAYFIWQIPKQLSKLRCRYRRTRIPIYWSKEEILHYDPWIALYHDVISDREINIVLNNSITQVTTTNLNKLSWWETNKILD